MLCATYKARVLGAMLLGVLKSLLLPRWSLQVFEDLCDSFLLFLWDCVTAIGRIDLVHELLGNLLDPAESRGLARALSSFLGTPSCLPAAVGNRVCCAQEWTLFASRLCISYTLSLDGNYPGGARLNRRSLSFLRILASLTPRFTTCLLLPVLDPEVSELNSALDVSEAVL